MGNTSSWPSVNSMSRVAFAVSRRYCAGVQVPCRGCRSMVAPLSSGSACGNGWGVATMANPSKAVRALYREAEGGPATARDLSPPSLAC